MQINVFLLGKHALNTRLGAKQAVSSVMTYTLVFRGAWMLWPGLVAPPHIHLWAFETNYCHRYRLGI